MVMTPGFAWGAGCVAYCFVTSYFAVKSFLPSCEPPDAIYDSSYLLYISDILLGLPIESEKDI
jgi:hypothetical protein